MVLVTSRSQPATVCQLQNGFHVDRDLTRLVCLDGLRKRSSLPAAGLIISTEEMATIGTG